jgi:transposase
MTTTKTLYVALELGEDKVLLACATEAAEKPRFRSVPARDLERLAAEIAKAKERFGLPADAPVCTCYEAGRDGFWLHRALTSRGLANVVVDSSSIEVDRRKKRVKTDPVDGAKLVNLLCRYHGGERKVWRVVQVPTVADEERRQLHRGLKDLQRQQTECSNRIKGLLASQGLEAAVDADFRTTLAGLRDWADQPVPAALQQRVLQEYAVWEALHRQVREAANEQERRLRAGAEPYLDQVRRLMGLKAVGVRSAWVLVAELFAWRGIQNGKELGALVGLTPMPYNSQRQEGAGAGDQQGRQQAGAGLDGGAGLAVAALAAGQRAQPVVRAPLRFGEQAGAEGGHRGAGAEAVDRAVALPGARRVAGGGGGEGLAAAGGFDGTAARQGGGPGLRRGQEEGQSDPHRRQSAAAAAAVRSGEVGESRRCAAG